MNSDNDKSPRYLGVNAVPDSKSLANCKVVPKAENTHPEDG